MNSPIFLEVDNGFINLYHIVHIEPVNQTKYSITTVNNSIHTVDRKRFDDIFLNVSEGGSNGKEMQN